MTDPAQPTPPPLPQDPYAATPGDPSAGTPGDPYGREATFSYGGAPAGPAYGQWAPPSQQPYQGVSGQPPPDWQGQPGPPGPPGWQGWQGQQGPQDWQGQQVWQAPQYAGQAPPWQSAYGRESDPLGTARTADAGPRLGARILDWLIVGIPFAVIGFALGYFTEPVDYSSDAPVLMDGAAVALQLAELVTRLVYQAAFVALKGATPGKMACGVRVVDERTGQRLSFGRALGREVVLMLSALLCLIGYFSLFFDSLGLKRGWHDKAVHSRVIR